MLTFCHKCAQSIIETWQEWPHRDSPIPVLPHVLDMKNFEFKLVKARLFSMHLLIATVMFVAVFSTARADYLANGKFWGHECRFVIMCNKEFVDAVDAGQGLHTIRNLYPEDTVDEFNSSEGVCHVKSKPSGAIGWALSFFGYGPAQFYKSQDDGSYKAVDIETLSFDCQEIK